MKLAERRRLAAKIKALDKARTKAHEKVGREIAALSDKLAEGVAAAKGIQVGGVYQMTSQTSARRMRVGKVIRLGHVFSHSEEMSILVELQNLKTGQVYGTDWIHTAWTNFHRIDEAAQEASA
jgi:hypothetical protein